MPRTAPDRQRVYRKRNRAKVKALIRELKNVPCVRCGVSYPYYVMDFHHRDPAQKSAVLQVLRSSLSMARIREEAAKCDMLCANCHRIVEAESAGYALSHVEEE